MANTFQGNAPTMQRRRKKTAKERREQKTRAVARAFQTVAAALDNVRGHRGGALRDVGTNWHRHILRPHPNQVPLPNFSLWRTYCKVVLHPCDESGDAASLSSSGDCSMQDPAPVQDEVENGESEELASRDDECEESASRSSNGSGRAHCNVALSQESGDDASDCDSEESAEVERRIVHEDPEQQYFFKTIYLSSSPRPEDGVGGNDSSCKFRIGDFIRPRNCLAELEAYQCGAVAQVVSMEEDGPCDIYVSYYDDNGNIKDERKMHFSEHFVKIGNLSIFDEQPHFPRSTLLKDRGALIMFCTDMTAACNSALSSAESFGGRTAK